ncbi:ABC transporter ATP-binding protein [Streptomyces turgidiscabies]|uniref:ABC transporter, ATP-binding protein n=1 Tax=Streptomyces turgidiscabies (strain Car8) TaxID=698760 RepID=L7F265_STRT8|nr:MULTISPECIES: ABC transporter ATP-binding protein [Streptomyces]ELP65407.1 ABC transporter, ATP-binding protein [Streptomyces turgidiscabies Car8]MDX3499686.1 ABC transporter ATP-binding protein [Streptomyces turgidiscabies]GAQ73368.1 lipopolysaccharide export system ATP-binding protein [Streptomyces turgidiscabies]
MNGLSVHGLSVSYGGVHALSGVDLDVAEGQLVGLIGPNGAGKTTFIDAVTGFARHDGRVELTGTDLSRLRPHARVRHGLARTWQSIELFDGLSVAENVAVATAQRSGWAATWRETFTRPTGLGDDIHEALSVVGLDQRADTQAVDLSQGERKLVGVARALAGRPRVLCLDEPAAGLDSEESIRLGRRLRAVVDAGTGMLLVDHDMALILDVCDTVVVLDFGKVIASGPPDQVREDPKVIAAYLGGAAAPAQQEAS